jgi:hypothetical protein
LGQVGVGIRIIVTSTVISATVITWISWCFGLFGRFFGNFLNVPSGRVGYAPPHKNQWMLGWWHGIGQRCDIQVQRQIGIAKSEWRISDTVEVLRALRAWIIGVIRLASAQV